MSHVQRFVDDRRGAIMVIGVFMSAFLVGAIWYMVGMGEAIVYREQMRAAADATAFDAATVHALGMNMIAMMNIVMAAIMAVVILLSLIFFIAVAITILLFICLLIPFLDAFCGGAIDPMINFDIKMVEWTNKFTDKFAFPAIKALNVSEGTLAIAMPWAAKLVASQVAGSYGSVLSDSDMFSVSMIPGRIPVVSDKAFSALDSKFQKLPIIKDYPNVAGENPAKLKITEFQRYGLPVQDDRFSILCTHGGMVLSNGFGSLLAGIVGATGNTDAAGSMSKGFDTFGRFFGMLVGSMPGLFCSGLSPFDMFYEVVTNIPVIGWTAKPALDQLMSQHPDLSKIKKKGNGDKELMNPMKPFDMSRNGNGWMQVWSTVHGNVSTTNGANMGVQVATWGAQSRSAAADNEDVDFAQGEFYFDCGAPDSGDDQTVLGFSDTSGSWDSCKYNAMWNLRWKARLRRYHQFDYDILKSVLLTVWSGTGAEKFIQEYVGKIVPGSGGALFKTQVIDRIKACVTGGGGNCPLPIPSYSGKVGIGGAPGGYDLQNEVFH